MIYLCDIDGTLADLTHRLHFIQTKPADWDAFFLACEEDTPIMEVISTVQSLKKSGAEILLLSGRSEIARDLTLKWLDKHEVPCDALYMREEGDHRQDNIVKEEFLDDLFTKWPREQVVAVFEDRKQVVEMYRRRGLRVFQVAEGEF